MFKNNVKFKKIKEREGGFKYSYCKQGRSQRSQRYTSLCITREPDNPASFTLTSSLSWEIGLGGNPCKSSNAVFVFDTNAT